LTDHYDTTTGPKREAASYRKIAEEFGLSANEILFVSDIVEELDAAQQAGMQTVLSARPGNAKVASEHGHRVIESFAQIQVGHRMP
jgi:enolase-phosphatase E1